MDIGDSFQNTTDRLFGFLPNLIGFLVILLVGYIVARVVAGVVGKLLDRLKVDQKLRESSASRYVDAALPGASPSSGIARVVFWLIFIFFIVTAIGALGIPAATGFMNQVLAYLPNVIVAILIFVIAALVSGAVAAAVAKFMGDTPTGKIVGSVVPALVMVIALFMILEQLQIAPEIVRIAFTAIMFALALGLALAFGLGGRDLAAELLRDAQRKGSEAMEKGKQDARLAADRAQDEYGDGGRATSPDPSPHPGGSATDPGGPTQQMPPAGGTSTPGL